MQNSNNWDPTGVPSSLTDVIFDSSVSHVNTSPSSTDDFSAASFNFPNSAQAFTFFFGNSSLQITDAGITGSQTNTTIQVTNTDNTDFSISEQVDFSSLTGATLGSAILNVTNTATVSGSDSGMSPSGVNIQIAVSRPFTVLSGGELKADNIGVDNSTGSGNNNISNVSYYQMEFDDSLTVGDDVTISYSNSGTNTSSGSSTYVALCEEGLFTLSGPFLAGNNLNFTASNIGIDSSTGTGNNRTATLADSHILCDDSFTVGNNATITITNSGTFTGTNSSSSNSVGYQSDMLFYLRGAFQAGDGLVITAANSGVDSSIGVGGNQVGYSNNTQMQFNDAFTVGNNATMSIGNSGTYTGSNSTNSSDIGYAGNPQLSINGPFQAGNSLVITAINTGTDNGSGVGVNVGYIDDPQVEFNNSCTIGNNAAITISNSGSSSTSAASFVGFVSGDQLAVGTFSSGENLTITVTNDGINTGNESSHVGYISGSQINFYDTCSLQNNTLLSVANNGVGVIEGPQMYFENGFSLTGKATFQATNEGTVGQGQGINIAAGTGGDVNIILRNNSLYVSGLESTFTIGALNGDAASSVLCSPELIIDTDSGVDANFAGSIQNFGLGVSTLVKSGPGVQTLSGSNTFTGLTSVDAGTLILTGSLAGDLSVNVGGLLKGTGNVAGNVVNVGKIAPGQSIGTIYFLSDFTNNNGEYDVEVNGAGESDLISVTGEAILNGGLVNVSSVDGTYRFQDRYTIVEAGSVVGTYSGATAVSALIQPFVTYDPQHVYLELRTVIERAAANCNQLAIALQLDGILNPSVDQSLLLSQITDLSIDDAREALDALSGYQHADESISTQMINRQFIRRLYDPVRSLVTNDDYCCAPSDDFGVWLDVGGSFTQVQSNSDAPGFNMNGYDVTGGVQKTFCHDWTVGIAGSYEQDHLDFKKSGGTEHCDTWFAGLYGLYRPSYFYGLVDFVYGNSSNKLNRKINVGTLHYHAKSTPTVTQYTFYGEVGVDYNICNILIQPFAGIEAGAYRRAHVKESDANVWALAVQSRNRTLATTRLGLHITTDSYFQECLAVSLDIAWNKLLSSSKNKVGEHFTQFGSHFEIDGVKSGTNSIDYALTISSPLGCNFSGYLEGSGESWSHANIFNILAGFEFCW
ncbi:MAG: autotransporter domain-containing protein [Parachlamydiaceae bacterium]